jgi:hypothetical protein
MHDTMERKRDGRFYAKILLRNKEKKSPIVAMIYPKALITAISGHTEFADGTKKHKMVQSDRTDVTLF